MSLSVDLFWSFRSPYSYLATARLVDLARTYALDIEVRVVQPIAVRDPDFFARCDPLFPRYLLRDCARVAEMLEIPFRWPKPDPIVMDMETREIAAEQPHIHRLSRLGVAAAERGKGLAFIDEVSRLLWDGETDDWHLGDHLARASVRAGLDFEELDAAITARPGAYDAALAENGEALRAAGHWGVPTMVFAGEPFFGQDRIALLLWRLKQNGLRQRSA